MNATSEIVETSMSALGTFQRCRKRYYYDYVLGWIPKSVPTVMEIGTLFHGAMAAGIATLKWNPTIQQFNTDMFLSAAVSYVYEAKVDRNSMPLHLDQGEREGVEDMVRYFFSNWLQRDILHWEEILIVEKPVYIQIGKYLIRNTLDVAVKYKESAPPSGTANIAGRKFVLDFKTCDDPRDSVGWIPLDFQTRSYPLAARGAWGESMPFRHIFQSRSVPPGFGHNPITTATGKDRNKATIARMSAPENFVGDTITEFTDAQLDHFEKKLVNLVMELGHAEFSNSYGETPIKMGPFSCGGCPFYAPCTHEMDGNPNQFNGVLYILRDSPEHNELKGLTVISEAAWQDLSADVAEKPNSGIDFSKIGTAASTLDELVPCQHEISLSSFPHSDAQEAASSFDRAVDEGLIDAKGNMLCNCKDWASI